MADQSKSSGKPPPRKMKFMPKIPPKKEPKVLQPKLEPSECASSDVIDNKLLGLIKQVEQGPGRRMPKTESKVAAMQVAFGNVDPRAAAKSYGGPGSVVTHQGGSTLKTKEYEDPWDYSSYYPVTLPLRLPHMGDPEVLDEAEFGSSSNIYDETSINPAKELGLTEDKSGQMLFFQFPSSLPLGKQPAGSAKGKETKAKAGASREKGCKLEELPAGFMGKLLVYKSGALKMKIGDALFNVSPGSDCVFAQDVMAINTQEKHCCVLGEIRKRAIVSPDLDDMLKSIPE